MLTPNLTFVVWAWLVLMTIYGITAIYQGVTKQPVKPNYGRQSTVLGIINLIFVFIILLV